MTRVVNDATSGCETVGGNANAMNRGIRDERGGNACFIRWISPGTNISKVRNFHGVPCKSAIDRLLERPRDVWVNGHEVKVPQRLAVASSITIGSGYGCFGALDRVLPLCDPR